MFGNKFDFSRTSTAWMNDCCLMLFLLLLLSWLVLVLEWHSNWFGIEDFIFDKHYFTVFEVNETNYKGCSEQGFITNITRGGRDVFNLTEPRPYYFLSSGGYCWHGMKVAINVTTMAADPAPSPSPTSSSTAPPSTPPSAATIILSLVFLFNIFFLAWLHVSTQNILKQIVQYIMGKWY